MVVVMAMAIMMYRVAFLRNKVIRRIKRLRKETYLRPKRRRRLLGWYKWTTRSLAQVGDAKSNPMLKKEERVSMLVEVPRRGNNLLLLCWPWQIIRWSSDYERDHLDMGATSLCIFPSHFHPFFLYDGATHYGGFMSRKTSTQNSKNDEIHNSPRASRMR